ncbi:MAG: alpha-1,2-fucosyltransferase, partial [Alphaproteobacteria bacterium]|nr:alpha-1,2-fucosyltransferase [Alphaproteobacteria bacterium]
MTITVRLVGGLGNQLFQYAAGRALAKQHRTDLWLDTSFLDKGNSHRPRAGSKSHITRRAYELHHWSCPAALVADLKPRRQDKIVEQPSFSFYKNFFSLGDDTYLIGYWQGYRYLAGMEQTVKAMFEPLKNPSAETQRLLKVIRDSNAAVMVHIRRGDYVHLSQAAKFHGTLTLDYYDQAMAWIEKKITKPHFFIFSDDA